jgi:hypothetical protein
MSFDTMFLLASVNSGYHVRAHQVQLVQLVHLDPLELQVRLLSELAKDLPDIVEDLAQQRVVGEQLLPRSDVLHDLHLALVVQLQHLIFVDFTFFNSFEFAV